MRPRVLIKGGMNMQNRYDRQSRISGWDQKKLTDAKVAIIGAGALGNFVALELALLGVGNIKIYDNDIIEETNLNRQFLYIDSVGKQKATTLAEKISEANPDIKAEGYNMKINELTANMIGEADVVIDCLDNLVTRAILNKYCVDKKIPFVSGATSPMEGQVMVYIPGETPCLDCQIGLYELAEQEKAADSCNRQPNPSVVMTNGLIGSIIAEEVRQILMPIKGDENLDGVLRYNGQKGKEFAQMSVNKRKECTC